MSEISKEAKELAGLLTHPRLAEIDSDTLAGVIEAAMKTLILQREKEITAEAEKGMEKMGFTKAPDLFERAARRGLDSYANGDLAAVPWDELARKYSYLIPCLHAVYLTAIEQVRNDWLNNADSEPELDTFLDKMEASAKE